MAKSLDVRHAVMSDNTDMLQDWGRERERAHVPLPFKEVNALVPLRIDFEMIN